MELTVHLTPKASRNQIESFWRTDNGEFHLKARVTTVPEKGKANQALFALLSTYFRVPKTKMTLLRGKTSRLKTIEIPLTEEEISVFLHSASGLTDV